jgi:hypothetical protein
MKLFFTYSALVLLLLCLQLGILPPLLGSWPVPNLLLLLVLLAALTDESEKSIFRPETGGVFMLAMLAGFFLDVFSPYRFGVMIFLFLALAVFVRFLSSRWIEREINYKSLAVVCFIAALLFPVLVAFAGRTELALSTVALFALVNFLALMPVVIFRYVRTW